MTLEDVRQRIEPEKDALRARGVCALYVFGSVARGEAEPGSDVDVLIEIEPGRRFNAIDLAGVYNRLTRAFGTEVDVVTLRSLKGGFRDVATRDRRSCLLRSGAALQRSTISSTRSPGWAFPSMSWNRWSWGSGCDTDRRRD